MCLLGFGSSTISGADAAYREAPNGPSSFTGSCPWSHSAYDDPIVHPGHRGHSHRHEFFGNRGTDARSTAAKLRRGRTTCSIPGDRSAYWTPSLFKGNRVVRPSRVLARYVNDGAGRRIRPFPKGLKMIAGNPGAPEVQSRRVVKWSCQGARADHGRIPRCRGRGVRLRVNFPSCWDGRRTDSADHRRHMAYRRWSWSGGWRCPRSHPVPVPTLTLDVTYPIRNGRGVFLASGRARTAHADFFNGWDQRELDRLTRRCLARGACGRWSRGTPSR